MTAEAAIVVAYVRPNCKCPPPRAFSTFGLTAEERAQAAANRDHDSARCPLAFIDDLTVGWYTVCRFGTTKREGGKGVKWTCTCSGATAVAGRAPTCRHLKALYAGNVVEIEDITKALGPTLKGGAYYVKLTPEGDDLLRPTWAANALKDFGDGRGS